jgi:P27 family predicted phage terminase small subunit
MNPRKPTKLKLIEGTFRKDRHQENEPDPVIEIPPCPQHLTGEAKVEWERITPELELVGLVSHLDVAALSTYCTAYAFVQATEKLCFDEEGKPKLFYRDSDNAIAENPHFGAWKRSVEILHRYATEFGMTPVSRSRINVSVPNVPSRSNKQNYA